MNEFIKELRDLATLHSEEDLIPEAETMYGQAADLIEQLQSEINALKAHVERLRDAGTKLRDDIDLSKIVGAGKRNFANEWDAAVLATPQQNLDAVKRELILELVGTYTHKLDRKDEEMNLVSINIIRKGKGFIYPEALIEYANIKYPSDKDCE